MGVAGAISRELRAQAALICDVEASTPLLMGESLLAAQYLGLPHEAGALARDAAIALFGWSEPEHYAEAALRLREGYNPGGWIPVIG